MFDPSDKQDHELLYRFFKDGKYFFATFNNREDAEDCAFGGNHEVRDYGVDIISYDPQTGRVTSWEKTVGFSVWVSPKKTQDFNIT
ncbi:MAG: hypothetical protein COV29_02525 [Candidatus Yanofskybacteria bacterium CG10_big_fil_rev_8_21_14_0_10_36_16]|uniref:Uncharacterized protein n=1 Tax=Candidatus Yanofskybacteria bacterium CG10_big_fil_rev_8_21_14_0_10_36_16 TaxID=1975096 RepID=A0A2J0Q835_9BACT|nr:MAG: hypothetical protein COV29_02525 [Candidatus Yanofskybacteria bacterium CG10_big_fil_rev_8_21_14_0_10_36_16]